LKVKRVSYPVFELDDVSSIRDIKLHLKKELVQYKKVGQLEKIILVQRRMTSVSTDSHTSLSLRGLKTMFRCTNTFKNMTITRRKKKRDRRFSLLVSA